MTVYLYENHNETLTAACCVNKNTDPTCQAKCVLEKTEKEQKETGELLKKEFAILFFQVTDEEKNLLITDIVNIKNLSFYNKRYSFSFLETTLKPPQSFTS